jgi:hypothetical protein
MPNGRGQLGADRAADPGAAAVGGASVRRATDIATHQDLRIKVLGPEPVEREPEHLEVLLRGVRAGAPGPQDRGERLTGLIQVAADRVKPVAVLVVAGPRSSSSAPSRASRRRSAWSTPGARPRPRPAPARPPAPSGCDRATAVDRPQHAVRRGFRRARTEQALPPLIRRHVGHAVAAVGQHHRHVPEHSPRIVRRATLPRLSQRLRQPPAQPDPGGQLRQQRRAACDTNPSPSAETFDRSKTSRPVHQLGVLPGRRSRLQHSRFSHGPRGRHPVPALRPIGGSLLAPRRGDMAVSAPVRRLSQSGWPYT